MARRQRPGDRAQGTGAARLQPAAQPTDLPAAPCPLAPVLLACAGTAMPSIFPDNTLTNCSLCGASIYHRPWALSDLAPGARAACFVCAARYAREHDQEGAPATAGISRQTLDEGAGYLAAHRR